MVRTCVQYQCVLPQGVKAIENNVCVTIMILSHNTNIFVIASYSSALEIAQHSWKRLKQNQTTICRFAMSLLSLML